MEKKLQILKVHSQIIVDYELLIKMLTITKCCLFHLENAFIKVSLKEFLFLQVITKLYN